eukprot:14658587-Ditylum_brightwellii.AAC.1
MKDINTFANKKIKEIIMKYPTMDIHLIKNFKDILLSNNGKEDTSSVSSSLSELSISSTSVEEE